MAEVATGTGFWRGRVAGMATGWDGNGVSTDRGRWEAWQQQVFKPHTLLF